MGTNRSTVGGETSSAVTDAVGTQADAADQTVGTDASTMAYVKGNSEMLGGAAGYTTFPAAAAAANAVNLAEVLRYLSEKQLPRFVTCSLTSMATTAQTADSPVSIFTVTGTILLTHIAGVCVTSVTSTGATGTLELGVTGSTAIALPQIAINGTNLFVAGDVWTSTAAGVPAGVLPNSGSGIVIGGGSDILLVVATNDMTAGAVDFIAGWIPLDATGALVSAI